MEVLNLTLLERLGEDSSFEEVEQLVEEGFNAWRSPLPSQFKSLGIAAGRAEEEGNMGLEEMGEMGREERGGAIAFGLLFWPHDMFCTCGTNREGMDFYAKVAQPGYFSLNKGIGGSRIFSGEVGNPHVRAVPPEVDRDC
jgi:hypothetical protein